MNDAGYGTIGQQRPMPPDHIQPAGICDFQLLEAIPVGLCTKLAVLAMALCRCQSASLQLKLATGWRDISYRANFLGKR